MRLMKTDVNWLLQLSEIVIIIGFAVLSTSLENAGAFVAYFIVYAGYLLLNYKSVVSILKKMKIELGKK